MPVLDFSMSRMANGNIRPARAVMLDTSDDFRVIEATAGAKCVGICTMAERLPPHLSDGFVAIAGEPVKFFGNGAKDVPAQLGGSVTAGDRLKATTAGKLITADGDGDEYVAVANQSGADGDFIAVDVTIGTLSVV